MLGAGTTLSFADVQRAMNRIAAPPPAPPPDRPGVEWQNSFMMLDVASGHRYEFKTFEEAKAKAETYAASDIRDDCRYHMSGILILTVAYRVDSNGKVVDVNGFVPNNFNPYTDF